MTAPSPATLDLARAALAEDAPRGDVTTEALVPRRRWCAAHVTACAAGSDRVVLVIDTRRR
jgi:nicotinate-nucleotide pyrophosphorylase